MSGGQSVINAGASSLAFINLAHGFTAVGVPANYPNLLNADGYPTTNLSVNLPVGGLADPQYFDRYLIWWTSTAAFRFNPATIVYSGGNCVTGVGPSTSGSVAGNFSIGISPRAQPTAPGTGGNGPVEFAFGTLIVGIADNGSGFCRIQVSVASSFVNGATYQINNVTNLAVGSYPITTVDTTHFDLLTVPFNGTMAVVGGGPGPQSEALLSVTVAIGVSGNFLSGNTISGLSGFVWCKKGDEAAHLSGQLASPVYVNQFQSLNPDFIRFMDFSGVQSDFSSSFTYRTQTSNLSWGGSHLVPDYYGNTITNGGASGGFSDVFTCTNPNASPSSGAFVDGEVVYGQMFTNSALSLASLSGSGTTVTGTTTSPHGLTIGTTLPIAIAGATPSGFNATTSNPASCLITGASTFTYSNVTSGSASPVGTYQVLSANLGYTPALSLPGRTGIAPVFSPQSNVKACLSALFLNGSVPAAGKIVTFLMSGAGLVGSYSPTYTVGSGGADNTLSVLASSLAVKLRADATLIAAGIIVPFNGSTGTSLTFQFNPNIGGLGASPLSVSASDNASAGIYNFGSVNTTNSTTNFTCGQYYTYTYSVLMGGWLATGTVGPLNGPPLEFYVDLCNRAGVGMWHNIGVMWSPARIVSTVTLLALSGVKKLALEFLNETWNAGEGTWAPATTMGNCLGINNNGDTVRAAHSFTGLRITQIAQLARAAWVAAGRDPSQLFIALEYQFVDMSAAGSTSTCRNRMQGASLDTTANATLAAFGGMGATPLSFNPSVAGNRSSPIGRPLDNADLIGGAPYWCGAQFNLNNGGTSISTSVPLAAYNGSLLAAYNYQYGNPTQQAAALDFLYNIANNQGDLYNGILAQSVFTASISAGVMTVSGSVTGSALAIGKVLTDIYGNGSIPAGVTITSGSGTTWGISNSSLSLTSQIIGAGAISTTNQLANFALGSGTINAGFVGVGTYAASFDSYRTGQGLPVVGVAMYEGDHDSGPVQQSEINGCAMSLNTLGIAASLGSNATGYSSGLPGAASGGPTGALDTWALAANNMALLLAAFKNDNRFRVLVTKYLTSLQAAATLNGTAPRIAEPAQFTFEGPSVWGMYPNLVGANPQPFQSWNAFQAFNNLIRVFTLKT